VTPGTFGPQYEGKLADYDLDDWEHYFPSWAYHIPLEKQAIADRVLLDALSKMSLTEIAEYIKGMHAACFAATYDQGY